MSEQLQIGNTVIAQHTAEMNFRFLSGTRGTVTSNNSKDGLMVQFPGFSEPIKVQREDVKKLPKPTAETTET